MANSININGGSYNGKCNHSTPSEQIFTGEIDYALSLNSTNAVANRVLKTAIDKKLNATGAKQVTGYTEFTGVTKLSNQTPLILDANGNEMYVTTSRTVSEGGAIQSINIAEDSDSIEDVTINLAVQGYKVMTAKNMTTILTNSNSSFPTNAAVQAAITQALGGPKVTLTVRFTGGYGSPGSFKINGAEYSAYFNQSGSDYIAQIEVPKSTDLAWSMTNKVSMYGISPSSGTLNLSDNYTLVITSDSGMIIE